MIHRFSSPPFTIAFEYDNNHRTTTYSVISEVYTHSHRVTHVDDMHQRKTLETVLQLMRANEHNWQTILSLIKKVVDLPTIIKKPEQLLDKKSYHQYRAPLDIYNTLSMVSMILCDISIIKQNIPKFNNDSDYKYFHCSVCHWHYLPQNIQETSFLSTRVVHELWKNNPQYFTDYVIDSNWSQIQDDEIRNHRCDILKLLFNNLRREEVVPWIQNHIIKSYARSLLGYSTLSNGEHWHYVQPPRPLRSVLSCSELILFLENAPIIIIELLQLKKMCVPTYSYLFERDGLLTKAIEDVKTNDYEPCGEIVNRKTNIRHVLSLHDKYPRLWKREICIEDIKEWSLAGQRWFKPPRNDHEQREEWEGLVKSQMIYIYTDTYKDQFEINQPGNINFEDIAIKPIARLCNFQPTTLMPLAELLNAEEVLQTPMTDGTLPPSDSPVMTIKEISPPDSPLQGCCPDPEWLETVFKEEVSQTPMTGGTLLPSDSPMTIKETQKSKKRGFEDSSELRPVDWPSVDGDPKLFVTFELKDKDLGWTVVRRDYSRKVEQLDKKTGRPRVGHPGKRYDKCGFLIPIDWPGSDYVGDYVRLPWDKKYIRNIIAKDTHRKRSKH